MARRTIYNKTQPALGNTEFSQLQATASGALRSSNGDGDVYTVTYSLDTSAYASADLVADTQAISTTAVDQEGGCVLLDSITLLDEDDQGVELFILIHSASTSMGTENSAPNISGANARNILGVVKVAAADYLDIGGSKVATIRSLGLVCKAASGSQALYTSIVNSSGTPTFTASGLQAKFGFRQL